MNVDYVIVGGGSAGCVLASRLSQDPAIRVLLIEAGDRDPQTAPPLAWPTLSTSSASWGDMSVMQESTGKPMLMAQGRGLGGGSAINAHAHMRGHHRSYDAWPSTSPGWNYTDLLPYFRRSENAVNHPGNLRGHHGPTVVSPIHRPRDIVDAWLVAAVQTGFPLIDDPGAGAVAGFGRSDFTVVNGRRHSVADAYLRPIADRPNLGILTTTTARRLIISGGRCIGVQYERRGGLAEVFADREVVLTAGAVGSPQLLMLSGIGPGDHLEDVGVPVLLDRPEVGRNLQDHPFATVVFRTPRTLPVDPDQPAGGAHGLVCSELAEDLTPDLQLIVIDVPVSFSGQETPDAGFSIGFSAMAPRSRGTVRLADSDPTTRPVIDPRFLSDHADVATMAAGLRIARRIGRATALTPWHPEEVLSGPSAAGPAADEDYVTRQSAPYNHLAGTCRMGTEETSVVDPELRVRGLRGLRVADSSVLPSLPSANINATVLALAERAADLIAATNQESVTECASAATSTTSHDRSRS